MPRQFRLTDTHYIDDQILEAGVIIGEGTRIPFLYPNGTPRPPTPFMEGLDEESQAEVDAAMQRYTNPETAIPLNFAEGEHIAAQTFSIHPADVPRPEPPGTHPSLQPGGNIGLGRRK